MYSYLFIFLVSLMSSFLLTPLIREWAKKKGWVDHPDGGRKIHTTPIPRIGGVGIYFAVLLSLVPVYFLNTTVALYLRDNLQDVLIILGLSGFMMLIGLWDDLKSISPWNKIILETLVAVLCWLSGFQVLQVWGQANVFYWGWLSLPVTVLWIVGITNAFNLIDGMDGLASGAALFSTLAMLIVSITSHQSYVVIFLAGLAGAILGFLRFNFSPASIFLGDSGSLLLGFLLSVVAITGSQKSTAAFSIAIPIVALGLPVVDTALSVARRFVRGRPIFSADSRHIHHVLLEKGLKPRHAVIVLYGICGLFGLFSLCFINPSGKTNGVILAILGISILFGIQKLRYSELSVLRGHVARGVHNQRRLLASGVVVKHFIDEIGKTKSLGNLMDAVGRGLEELCFSRFEIVVPVKNASDLIKPSEGWDIVPLAVGGTVLRWTSACRHCTRILESGTPGDSAVPGNSGRANTGICEECVKYKNPILQKSMVVDSKRLVHCSVEYQIAMPLSGKRGEDLGMIKFHYPAGDDYPVSAIAMLSENIGEQFEKAVQRILRADVSIRKALLGKGAGSALTRSSI